jgi:hypothetical protein
MRFKAIAALLMAALLLSSAPHVAKAGPITGGLCYACCVATCGSVGAAAFAAGLAASGGAIAAAIPTGGSAVIAGCGQLCMMASAYCVFIPCLP